MKVVELIDHAHLSTRWSMTPCSSQRGVLPVMAMLAWCTISDTYKTITSNVLDDLTIIDYTVWIES